MSWLQKLLPPKINRTATGAKKNVPEGLWSKCPSCAAVLYATDLEKNANVCPKCGYHNRIRARARLELLLDPEGRFEIGTEVAPVDSLKFKDDKRYPERLEEAEKETGETDALVVMQGAIKNVSLVAAVFEFEFMGGSMGSVVGERFVPSTCRSCASPRRAARACRKGSFRSCRWPRPPRLSLSCRRASSRSSPC